MAKRPIVKSHVRRNSNVRIGGMASNGLLVRGTKRFKDRAATMSYTNWVRLATCVRERQEEELSRETLNRKFVECYNTKSKKARRRNDVQKEN